MTLRINSRSRRTANRGNCITKEHDTVKEATLRCAKAQNELEKAVDFIKVPIFKGYKLVRKQAI